MPSYNYNPTKIAAQGMDQMRFELGDTVIDSGALTCALCDEEYSAIIDAHFVAGEQSWNFAKFKCLEAIFTKMSYEVDYKIGSMSYSMSQRAAVWKEMYLKAKASQSCPITASGALRDRSPDGGHYFYGGMQNNQRARS